MLHYHIDLQEGFMGTQWAALPTYTLGCGGVPLSVGGAYCTRAFFCYMESGACCGIEERIWIGKLRVQKVLARCNVQKNNQQDRSHQGGPRRNASFRQSASDQD